ncbi:MAG: hypothetical protein LBQ24_02820 [Candidatus Peribacteria bacterium]|nr:hypothetical protein [Candidatus Peribacteria bacterium]
MLFCQYTSLSSSELSFPKSHFVSLEVLISSLLFVLLELFCSESISSSIHSKKSVII